MLINILRYSRFLDVYKSLWENPTSGAAGAVMVQFLGSQTNMMRKTTGVVCGGMFIPTIDWCIIYCSQAIYALFELYYTVVL